MQIEPEESQGEPTGQEVHETFDEDALFAAAVESAESVEDGDEDGGEQPSAAAPGEHPAAAPGALPALDDLRKVAAERAKAFEAQKPAEPAPAQQAGQPAQPDLSALADGLSGAKAMREAMEAFKTGDGSKLAEVMGVDEATLYERWTDRAIRGETSSIEQKLNTALKRIEELEGRGLPDDVLTAEKLAEREQQAKQQQTRDTFTSWAQAGRIDPATGEKVTYPTLGALAQIDPNLALRYGSEAEELVKAHGLPLTLESVAHYAEQIAHEKHGALFQAQQQAGTAQQTPGGIRSAAASSATPGSKKRPVTIDNRAAAEVASSLPDFEDEDAFLARARVAAESL